MNTTTAKTMTHREIMLVLLGLAFGMFLASLDQTVVSTAMRTIADDLQGLSQQAWVTTSYLIVSTVVTPIAGKLSDIFGRRPVYIISIGIFLLGSLLSGLANSMIELAAFRAVQGLGAGGLMSLAFTIIADIIAPRERARYQGLFIAVFGVSSVLGPLIGGFFAGTAEIVGVTGWRWVFLLNLPVGAIALFMVWRFLHVPQFKQNHRIDWLGVITVIAAVTPLLLVAENGREWGWTSANAMLCYSIGVAGIVGFIAAEKKMGEAALIPLSLFKSVTFSQFTVLGVLVGFSMFGAMMTIPLFLQLVVGSTPTESGIQMLPMVMGMMIATGVGGAVISKTGRYTWLPIIGTGLMFGAFLWLSQVNKTSGYEFIVVGMLVIGVGIGLLMQTLSIASQNAVESKHIGVATSSSTFFRQIGGTLGTAVLFSVLFGRIPEALAEVFSRPETRDAIQTALRNPDIANNPANEGIITLFSGAAKDPESLSGALSGDTSFLNGASPELTAPFVEGFAASAQSVYLVAMVIAGISFVMSWFIKTQPLRDKSAMEENLEAQAAAAL